MNKSVAAVCAAFIVLTCYSEKCNSIEIFQQDVVTNDLTYDEDLFKPVQSFSEETKHSVDNNEDISFFYTLFKRYNDVDSNDLVLKSDESEEATKRRVVRQAYQGQVPLYPNLPPTSPYGPNPYPSYNNQKPYNPQWQPSYNNNFSQPGYPSQTNGYRPNASGTFGSSTPSSYNNYNQQYPYSGGNMTTHQNPSPYNNYSQPHNSHSGNTWPQPPYSSNPYRQPPHQPWSPQQGYNNNTPRPYNPHQSNYPSNSNNSTRYPGYNSTSSTGFRPPYGQPSNFQNSSYAGYPYTPGTNQKPSPYPSQTLYNSTYRPGYPGTVAPGIQHPVVYDDSTHSPGHSPNNYNVSQWSGPKLNNTYGTPGNNFGNGQSNNNFNSYPGFGSPNSTYSSNGTPYKNPSYPNPNNPYNSPNQGFDYRPPPYQNPSGGYPNYPSGPNSFNPANGYNPSIPSVPPYGGGPTSNNNSQSPYGSHDPTRVSPHHFNSY